MNWRRIHESQEFLCAMLVSAGLAFALIALIALFELIPESL